MKAASCWEVRFRGEEVIQEGSVNLHWGVGLGEVGEARGLAGSDELLCRPYVVGCGPSKEIGPVGVFSFLDRLEVSLLREPGEGYEVFRAVLFGQPRCFCVFLAYGGEVGGPPGFRLGRGA